MDDNLAAVLIILGLGVSSLIAVWFLLVRIAMYMVK